eukprot:554279-Amphidinium_carterae.1
MIQALIQAGPNSGKMHSTFQHQTPEWYAEVMSVLKSADGMKTDIKESVGEAESSSSNTKKTMVNITIGDEEEME